jgi:pyruvyltransferase
MNVCLICCNDRYVPKAIIALKQFSSYNEGFIMAIIGTSFSDNTKQLCNTYDIKLVEIDLSNDFKDLHKRPYGKNYPIECFYHFYAYKLFPENEFIISIEPDICTNKKLDIDLHSIQYIGGSYEKTHIINDFAPIMNDYKKIKARYGEHDTSHHRILPGVKVYNIKGLESVNFYETIVEHYTTSLEIQAPRCGDDSLMVLYQLLHPTHVTLLKQEFNVIWYNKDMQLQNITFYHFAGVNSKYWDIKNSSILNNHQRYFYDSMIEYVYNNFSSEFIKVNLPIIYIDIPTKIKIPFFYYNNIDNFGDLITPYLLSNYCNKDDYTFNFKDSNTAKIISCGSIMRMCNEKVIVYGSGIRNSNQDIKKGVIRIVRGPLTRKRLLEIGCYCPPIYGDPGLLLPLYYNPTITKTHKLGIVPHHIHYTTIHKMYNDSTDIKVINVVNKNIESVIDDILCCEKIISSSLHGLIISDAYNIPNKWVKFNNEIYGDDTKFYDYFLSVHRSDTTFIDCMNYKEIPDDTFDIITNTSIQFDINYLQEKFFMDKNGIKNYTKYLYIKIIQEPRSRRRRS